MAESLKIETGFGSLLLSWYGEDEKPRAAQCKYSIRVTHHGSTEYCWFTKKEAVQLIEKLHEMLSEERDG